MIIFVVSDIFLPHRSGIVRGLTNIVSGLTSSSSVEVVLCTFAPARHYCEPLEDSIDWLERVKHVKVSRNPLLARRQVRQAFAQFKPDVVHAFTPFFLARISIKTASSLGIPSFLAVNLFPLDRTRIKCIDNHVLSRLVGLLYTWAHRQSCRFIAPSAFAARYTQSLVKHARVTVLSNGSYARAERPPTQSDLKDIKVLYVGRLSQEKNIDSIIKAIHLARREQEYDLTLELVGSGPHARKLQKLATRLGVALTMHGSISDEKLSQIYQSASIFCIASHRELECIAALEAMSFGVPVIAPRRGALVELARPGDGVLFVADGRDAHSISDCLSQLVYDEDLRRRTSLRAYSSVEAKNLSTTTDRLFKLYHQVAGDPGHSFSSDNEEQTIRDSRH